MNDNPNALHAFSNEISVDDRADCGCEFSGQLVDANRFETLVRENTHQALTQMPRTSRDQNSHPGLSSLNCRRGQAMPTGFLDGFDRTRHSASKFANVISAKQAAPDKVAESQP
jgi:hypothetical protein